MSIEVLTIGDPFFSIKILTDESAYKIEGKTIALNLSRDPIRIREQSLGDATVKKHATNHAAALYGRLRAYEQALGGVMPMEDVLARNLYGEQPKADQAETLPTILPRMRDLLGQRA